MRKRQNSSIVNISGLLIQSLTVVQSVEKNKKANDHVYNPDEKKFNV